jgi:hypothetical protein
MLHEAMDVNVFFADPLKTLDCHTRSLAQPATAATRCSGERSDSKVVLSS